MARFLAGLFFLFIGNSVDIIGNDKILYLPTCIWLEE